MPPHVVIIGGGFGGLAAARGLRRAPVRVTLVDRHNHHLFQPLLYQVAVAELNEGDIAAPLRRVLRRQRNAEVLLAEVTGIDLPRRRVRLADGELAYDYLVVATGATHSYFGRDEYARVAPGLKTLEDALVIRRKVLLAFERAERLPDGDERRAWLTFVIVGGGPTGVELAGAFSEIARLSLRGEFRHVDPAQARVVLVEAMDRVLSSYPPSLSEAARQELARLGVEVRLRAPVTAVDEWSVQAGGERLSTRTVVWAAGVAASPLGRAMGAPLDRAGRVRVEADLSVPGHPEVLVVGDLASVVSDGRPVPGIAPAAMQEGRHAARVVRAHLAGAPPPAFRYRDKGTLAAIGRTAAVADLGRVKLSGFVAWVLWVVVHIFFLIGFRNRVAVLATWAWAYLSNERAARLILRAVEPMPRPPRRPGARDEPPPSAPRPEGSTPATAPRLPAR